MAKKKKEENAFQKSADELHSMINVLEQKDGSDIIPQLQVDKKEETETDSQDKTATHIPSAAAPLAKQPTGVKSVPSFLQKPGEQLKPTKENPLVINPSGQSIPKAPVEEATSIQPPLKKAPSAEPPIPPAPPMQGASIQKPAPQFPLEGQQTEQAGLTAENPAAPAPAPEQLPEQSTGNIFIDIGIFMQELTQSFNQRYDMWENSTNLILSVLRKMQMINQENAEVLVVTLEQLHEKTKNGLEKFRIKRDAMEEYSDTNYQEVCAMLKKTLDLLALQLKEFKLKMLVNQFTEIYSK